MASTHPIQAKTQQAAAVRRAIMSVVPEYFSWPTEVQERYRATLPHEDYLRFRQALLKIIFDIKTTSGDVKSELEDFSDGNYLLLNSAMLQLTGIGDDCFFLNESMADNTSLLDFETVYDYDYADHCFQETMREKDDPAYIAKPYRGTLYDRWARLHINGIFHYATLYLLASYVNSRLEEVGSNKIDELIPHQYVDGKNHGKREGSGTIFDMRIDADGLEGQLDELKGRYYAYLFVRCDMMAADFDTKSMKQVYCIDTSRGGDPHMDFVFTDKTTLQAVRFRKFTADCQAIKGNPDELAALIETECQAMLGFLEQAHQDIMAHFDPKVVKLRKKNKVILSDVAAKDLLS